MSRILAPCIFYLFMTLTGLMSGMAIAETNDSGVKVSWSYKGNNGPSYWGQLSPGFILCATGKSQSPININRRTKQGKMKLTLQYAPATLFIVNDGSTDLMLDHTQTLIYDGHGIQVNFPPQKTNETITFDYIPYRLLQFHIHTPSENQWHGQTYPMEIHFVHQGEQGQVAVLGVLVKVGKPNLALQSIIDHLPKEKGKEYAVENTRINPIDLLPVKQDYYYFTGSLTTPPCTQGLQWVVMANAITASPAQIVQLRKAVGGANARPVQPVNGRTIFYSTIGNK